MINLGFTFQCLWCAPKPFGRPSVSAKEKPSEAPPADGDNDAAAGEDAPKKKGLGLIPMVAGAVIAAGVAGGAAFVLTPGAKHENPACVEGAGEEGAHGEAAPAEECVAEDHGGKDTKPEKKSADKGHGGDSGSSNVKPLGEVQHTDYATFVVLDARTIAFAELRSPNTVRNIARNAAVEVNFVDPFVRKGYRFQGRAVTVARYSAEFPALFAAFGNLGSLSDIVRAVVRINIEDAEPLISPAYDRGLSEQSLRRDWTRKFRAMQPGGVFDTGD